MIQVPDADDVTALAAVASQAGLSMAYAGSVQNAIKQVAQAGGVSLVYSGSDRNAIELLAGLLSGDQPVPYVLRLDDDGTLAAAFGGLWMPTQAPEYLKAVHDFTDPGGEFVRRYAAVPAGIDRAAPAVAGVQAFQVIVEGMPVWDYADSVFRQVSAGGGVALVDGDGIPVGSWTIAIYQRNGAKVGEDELAGLTLRVYSSDYEGGLPILSAPIELDEGGRAVIGVYVETSAGQVGVVVNGDDLDYVPGLTAGPVSGILPGLTAEELGPIDPFSVDLEMVPAGPFPGVVFPSGALDLYGSEI